MSKFSHYKRWPVYLLIISVTLLIASGGATNQYSQVFLLFVTGGLMVVTPIRKLPERRLVVILLGFVVWMVISTWMPFPFDTAADWIQAKDPTFRSGNGISAQPYLSMEKIGFALVGILWFLLVVQKPLDHHRRMDVMRLIVWMTGLLALVTVLGVVFNFQHPLTWGTHRFSFFPNHNQSGSILALGGILCQGFIVRTVKKRDWAVVAFSIVMVVISLALMLGMSRGAILSLAVGCCVYLLLTLEKKNYQFYLKLGIPILVLFVASFLIYGGNLLDEFLTVLRGNGVDEEMRIKIWLDSSNMALAFPLFGIGLGNFRYFFPFFYDRLPSSLLVHHPESDLLWLWIELGLVGVVFASLALFYSFKRLNPRDLYLSKGLRLAGFVAIAIFVFSLLIEVSGHRLGSALFALVIYGVVQPEGAKLYRISGLGWVSRILGLFIMLAAAGWVYGMVHFHNLSSRELIDYSKRDISELIEHSSEEELEASIEKWIVQYPLVPELRELKGLYAVRVGDKAAAATAFDEFHKLRSTWWRPFINHGVYLRELDFNKALEYWTEGLELAGENRVSAFYFIIRYVSDDLKPELRPLTYDDKLLQFCYFGMLSRRPIVFSREVGRELAVNPDLSGFSSEQKQSILWQFGLLNGQEVLKRLLDRFPSLASENWTIRALVDSLDGDFKEASRLAVMNFPEPDMIDLTRSRTLTAIRTDYVLDSDDSLKVIALVQKQKEHKAYADALITLEVAKSKGVEHPYLDYELALMNFYLERYEASWRQFKTLINRTISWKVKTN